jgi:hypothetical protein
MPFIKIPILEEKEEVEIRITDVKVNTVGVVTEEDQVLDGEDIELGKLYIIMDDTRANRDLQVQLILNS